MYNNECTPQRTHLLHIKKHFKDSDQEYISLNEVYDYVRDYFELYFEVNYMPAQHEKALERICKKRSQQQRYDRNKEQEE